MKKTVIKDGIDVKYLEVFENSVKSGESHDNIKMLLLKAGAKFSEVNSLFNKLMIEKGMRLSHSDKANVVKSSCSGKDLTIESDYNLAVDSIVEKAQVSITSAVGSIRGYAKTNGIEYFKTAKVRQGQSGFSSKFYKVLVATPDMGMGAVDEYINTQPDRNEGSEISKNVIKHASMYRGIAKLVNDVYSNAVNGKG